MCHIYAYSLCGNAVTLGKSVGSVFTFFFINFEYCTLRCGRSVVLKIIIIVFLLKEIALVPKS